MGAELELTLRRRILTADDYRWIGEMGVLRPDIAPSLAEIWSGTNG